VAWPSLTVAVNVSPIQFGRPDLADRCCRVLSETGFDGSRLEIEITESALLEAEHAVLRAMERLRARGVTFALDDFGPTCGDSRSGRSRSIAASSRTWTVRSRPRSCTRLPASAARSA